MPIKRSSIELLKSKVNILDVAGRYTTLKKRGKSYVGLSPFTKEKTPSFTVDPLKNVYYCFSSNQGGDLISLVQAMEHMEFYEAIESLAEKFGVALEYEEGSPHAKTDRSLKKEILEIHLYAAEFFQKCLAANHPEAKAARDYWTQERKFAPEVAQEFGVGYAPASSNKLLELLTKKGFSYEAMSACGLFFPPRNDPARTAYMSSGVTQRFRGRLMIPLRDPQGNVIGFTGRKMPMTPADDPAFEAKYVNSPETLLFKKGLMLFNFDRARKVVEEQKFFLMVEGQLDAIRVSSAGYGAVIAPQGTAITPEQLSLIKRYDSRLKVFLDGDRAGQAAALRMLPMALSAELDLTFLTLPAGMDPDLYFVQNPTGGLKKLPQLSPIAFALQALWPQEDRTAQAKTNALREIFGFIASCPSAITQEAYIEELIKLQRLEPRSVRIDFEKALKAKKGANKELEDENLQKNCKKTDFFDKNLTTAEEQLLWLLVHIPRLAGPVAKVVAPEWLDANSTHARLLNSLLAEALEGAWEEPGAVERISASTQERDFLFGLLGRPLPPAHDPHTIANNCIQKIYMNHINSQIVLLDKEIAKAETIEEKAKLARKQQQLANLKLKQVRISE